MGYNCYNPQKSEFQLMVRARCFGARWFGALVSRDTLKNPNPFHKGILGIPNHQTPQTKNVPLVHYSLYSWFSWQLGKSKKISKESLHSLLVKGLGVCSKGVLKQPLRKDIAGLILVGYTQPPRMPARSSPLGWHEAFLGRWAIVN